MTNFPYVSIIVPTYNDWNRLQLCLEALSNQTYPSDNFEVLIVNNNPGNFPNYNFSFPNFKLLEEARPGSYAARNTALRYAQGQILAFTDSDCIPDCHWLACGVNHLISGHDRVAGHVQNFIAGEVPTLAEAFELVFAFNQQRNAHNGTSVTANLMCHSYCFHKTGLFNDTLLSGGDFEWGYRATTLGFNISYQKDVIVKHPARNTLSALLQKTQRKAGGSQAIQSVTQRPRSLLRSLIPPISSFKAIITFPSLSPWCKLRVIFLTYFLRQYSTYCYFLLYKGWSKPIR